MSTNTEANKSVVRRYLQAVVDGDAETIEMLHHPDARYWSIGRGHMDRETYMGGTKKLSSASKRRVDIKSITAEEDRVSVECESEFVFGDKVYRNIYNNMFIIRDGFIVEGREYMDPRVTLKAF